MKKTRGQKSHATVPLLGSDQQDTCVLRSVHTVQRIPTKYVIPCCQICQQKNMSSPVVKLTMAKNCDYSE